MTNAWLVSRHIVIWMIAAYFISLLMLMEYTPWWILPFSGVVIGWRWLYVVGKVSVFNKFAHHSLTIAAIGMLIISSLSSGMLENMVNLLLLAYGLKFIELRKLRDVFVLVVVGLITIAIVFIYSESLTTTIAAAVLVVLQLSILVGLHAPAMLWREQLKVASKISALSLPLTISLFLIMPQLGPLWSMSFAGGVTTGLSESMSPGDIAQLRGSDALAFSVIFDDEPVVSAQRYWRALVLDDFDGKQWQQKTQRSRWQPYEDQITWTDLTQEPSIGYKIIAKSSNQHWLFGLNVATSPDADVKHFSDLTLKSKAPVVSTMAYRVISYPQLASKLTLSTTQRHDNLQVPTQTNQQTKQWVEEQRPRFGSDLAFAQSILKHFNQQPFFYTLEPPLLVDDSVDDFMFNTQQGFCAHYASAFALIMRYANIPARVVTGYYGGEWNEEIGYLNVYQYDAHAWNEIWIRGSGWIRIDPTASINPQRVLSNLSDAQDQAFFGGGNLSLIRYRQTPWINSLRLSLANIEFYWSSWVVQYNADKQQQLLNMLLGKLNSLKIISFTLVVLTLIGLLLWWQSGFRWQRVSSAQRFERIYLLMTQQMDKRGVAREKHLSPNEYCIKISAEHPHIRSEIQKFTDFYNKVKYQKKQPVSRGDVTKAKRLYGQLLQKI